MTISNGNSFNCTAGTECQIDCSNITCAGIDIDGTLATKLIISCNTPNACNNTNTYCPINGPCQIDCTSIESCNNLQINSMSTNITQLSLNCIQTVMTTTTSPTTTSATSSTLTSTSSTAKTTATTKTTTETKNAVDAEADPRDVDSKERSIPFWRTRL